MPSLKAYFGLDASEYESGLDRCVSLANAAGKNISKPLNESGHVRTGPMRETLVLLREVSRGNWSRVPGSLTILLQQTGLLGKVFKDTAVEARGVAAALAKKAAASTASALATKEAADGELRVLGAMARVSPATLLAAKAKQDEAVSALAAAGAENVQAAAAARNAEALEAQGMASRLSLGPIGLLAIGLAAVAAAAYFTYQHFAKLREEQRNFADLTNFSADNISDQAQQMRYAAAEAQAFSKWLHHLADDQHELADATNEALDALRERGKLERELMEARGASKTQLDAAELAERQKELSILNAAIAQAKADLKQHAREGEAANAANTAVNGPDAALQSELMKHREEIAKQVFLKASDALASAAPIQNGYEDRPVGELGAPLVPKFRTANESDKFDVTVDGKRFSVSVAEARKAFDDAAAQAQTLAEKQKAASEALEQAKSAIKGDNTELQRLTKEANKTADSIALHKIFDPKIAAARDGLPGGGATAENHFVVAKESHSRLVEIRDGISGLRDDLKKHRQAAPASNRDTAFE